MLSAGSSGSTRDVSSLVSELYPGTEALPARENYSLQSTQYYEVESSFAHHHVGEVLGHWTYKKGGNLTAQEVRDITSTINIMTIIIG